MKKQKNNILIIVAILALVVMSFNSIIANEKQEKKKGGKSPISIDLSQKKGFASLTNNQHPGNKIGYRFFEHVPLVFGTTPKTNEETNINIEKQEEILKDFVGREDVIIYKIQTNQTEHKEHWVDQSWTFYMVPVEDGIDMLLVIQTEEIGLPSYYGAQQCFRMSGKTNKEWRRAIAETPSFSEYDLWESQEENERTSLSWVLRNNIWEELPAMDSCVGARTPSGVSIDNLRFQGDLTRAIGPNEGIPQKPVDLGLTTRTNVEGTWISGLFWENTSHITDHHPADCLHAIVNIGNIPPHSKRVIRGKIYWFEGTKDDLLKKWREDFTQHLGLAK